MAKVKTGCVCKACNNGWMSDLEHAAQPVLGPMIAGEPRSLSRDEQELTATWAIKTSMTLQYKVPTERFMPQHLLSRIREHQTPTPHHRVYISALTGEGSPRGGGTKWLDITRQGQEDAGEMAFMSVLLVGMVVLQITVGAVPPLFPPLFQRIWPTAKPFGWPKESIPRKLAAALPHATWEIRDGAIWWNPPQFEEQSETSQFLGT